MRLIDADTLPKCDGVFSAAVIESTIKNAPTIDAVPVVRCRDCEHYEVDPFIAMSGVPIAPPYHVCKFWAGGCMTNPDGYCFAGVKKEDQTDDN